MLLEVIYIDDTFQNNFTLVCKSYQNKKYIVLYHNPTWKTLAQRIRMKEKKSYKHKTIPQNCV